MPQPGGGHGLARVFENRVLGAPVGLSDAERQVGARRTHTMGSTCIPAPCLPHVLLGGPAPSPGVGGRGSGQAWSRHPVPHLASQERGWISDLAGLLRPGHLTVRVAPGPGEPGLVERSLPALPLVLAAECPCSPVCSPGRGRGAAGEGSTIRMSCACEAAVGGRRSAWPRPSQVGPHPRQVQGARPRGVAKGASLGRRCRGLGTGCDAQSLRESPGTPPPGACW